MIVNELKNIINDEGITIADWGCGNGELIRLIFKHFSQSINIVGIDFSRVALDAARSYFPKGTFHTVDFENDTPPDEVSSDINICSEVIEHVNNWESLLANIVRCTKSNGHIIITTQGGKRFKSDLQIGHLKHFSLHEITDVLENQACHIKNAYRTGFPFYTLQKLVQSLFIDKVNRAVLNNEAPTRIVKILYLFGYWAFRLCPPNRFLGPQLVVIAQKK